MSPAAAPPPPPAPQRLAGWLRVALRDLRGGLERFAVLLACLALGVATIAITGSVGEALQEALARDARLVLGGDVEAGLSWRAATPAERELLAGFGPLTETVDVAGRARAESGSAFVALRAVDAAYPLLGTVSHDGPAQLADLLAPRDGRFGAVADPLLFDRLGLAPGDTVTIGDAEFELRARLLGLPDQVTQGFSLGVPVLVSLAGLDATGIIGPGVLARHRYKLLLDEPGSAGVGAALHAASPEAGWQMRDPRDATEDLARGFDIFSRFLTMVALAALLVGGVGVANAVSAYVTGRQRAIATLRSLGATSRRIMVHFLVQVAVLIALGVGLGLLLGVAVTLVALPVIGAMLAIALPPSLHVSALLAAAAFGLLAGFAFAWIPLARATAIRPALLFRTVGTAPAAGLGWRRLLRPGLFGPPLLAFLAMLALAAAIAPRPALVPWYALGAILAFGLLRLAAYGLQRLLRVVPALPDARLRQAFAALHRPGAPAPTVIVSLGLGLALLLLIALVDGNLRGQLQGEVVSEAPSFVFMDLFPEEVEALAAFAEAEPLAEGFVSMPMLRGALVAVGGAPLAELGERAESRFEGETPLTWAAELPAGGRLAEGEWWPPDHAGPQLVSVDEDLREPLALALGETLTFRIFGETLTATIAGFHDGTRRGSPVDFDFVLSPGPIQGFPMSHVGLLKAAEGQDRALQPVLVERFPDLIFLPVGDALAAISRILDTLTNAIAIVGGLALLSGLFVLAGALAAGRRQREADATVMKVLGATRGDVVAAFVVEYGLLGALAALLAALIGSVAAWAFVTQVLDLAYRPLPGLVAAVVVTAMALTILAGMLTTWSALSVRPARFLRDE